MKETGENRFPADAAQVWVEVSGALIRGIVHTLNNRVAAVEGIAATLEDDEDIAALSLTLAGEGERLRALTELARGVSDERAAPETTTLSDLIGPAIALARLHPDLRDAAVNIHGMDSMPALRVRQRKTMHALVLAILAAAADGAGNLEVHCTEGSYGVELLILPVKHAELDDDSRMRTEAANALLAMDGGSAELQERSGSRTV